MNFNIFIIYSFFLISLIKTKINYNMENKETIEKLKQEFFTQFGHKYELVEDWTKEEGCYACVFKCIDKATGVPVAVKLFFEGIAPEGSKRGWHITSTIIHRQIAPTLTIETFKSKILKTDCQAVIQRFIPGKPLGKIFEWFNEIEGLPVFNNVLDDFGITFFPSLLEALNLCHGLGHGHGDFHPGNIIVFSVEDYERHSFNAVLIDFDNSSIKETLNKVSEKEKIRSDISLLKRLYGSMFHQWRYYAAFKIIMDSYHSVKEINYAYSSAIEFIKCIKRKTVHKKSIDKMLAELPYPFIFHTPPLINCLKTIAELDNISEFNLCLDEYKKRASNINNWTHETSMTVIDQDVNTLYKGFFK